MPFHFDSLRRLFAGQWTFLRGNHDENNGVKCVGDFMFCNIGKYRAFVGHFPLGHPEFPYPPSLEHCIAATCDVVLCGHVHNRWVTNVIGGCLHINVGVDVRGYFPVEDADIVSAVDMYTTA